MKTHYGVVSHEGDYECPCDIVERTLCGCDGEEVCMESVEDWDLVDCKRCLRMKEGFIAGCRADEEVIVRQMGEFVDMNH